MATTVTKLMTFAEFEKLPEAPCRQELRHGEVIDVPPPVHKHYRIQLRIRDLLAPQASNSGIVGIEFGFRPHPDYEYRIADVVFISLVRWKAIKDSSYLEGAPDLVIEVLSPSNTAAEMLDKEQICLENGCQEFWVVDARHHQVKVSTREGRTATYKAGQLIPLFFGGSISIDEIFA
jgi:Uma2 family endonuclease